MNTLPPYEYIYIHTQSCSPTQLIPNSVVLNCHWIKIQWWRIMRQINHSKENKMYLHLMHLLLPRTKAQRLDNSDNIF